MTMDWQGNYVTCWSFNPVGTTPREYALAIAEAWAQKSWRFRGRLHAHSVSRVVEISVEVTADDLASAIERGRRIAFESIDSAWLQQPDTISLIAARRPRRRRSDRVL